MEGNTGKRDTLKPCLVFVGICIFVAAGVVHMRPWLAQKQSNALQKSLVVIPASTSPDNGTTEEDDRVKLPKFRHGQWQSDYRQRLPTCLIIGVRKGGTRALLRMLDLHPDIRAYRGRELHFFDSDTRYSRGLAWYRKKMPYSWPHEITVEKTPAYFHTLTAPKRIKLITPNSKFLLVVRDPVVRLISDYVQLREKNEFRGNEYPSFSECVLWANGSVASTYPPVRFGYYDSHLRNWLSYFDRRQILVVSGENLIRNPLEELRRVESFLGVGHKIRDNQILFSQEKGFSIDYVTVTLLTWITRFARKSPGGNFRWQGYGYGARSAP